MQLADRNTRAGRKRFTRIRGPRNGNLAAIRFFFSVAAGQNYDPAPEVRERWWQGRAMGLRRPLLAGLVASNGSWVSKKMQACPVFSERCLRMLNIH